MRAGFGPSGQGLETDSGVDGGAAVLDAVADRGDDSASGGPDARPPISTPQLDLTFGEGTGVVRFGSAGKVSQPKQVRLLSGGRIAVAGQWTSPVSVFLAILSSSGSIEPSFNGGQALDMTLRGGADSVTPMLVLADETLLLGGRSASPTASTEGFVGAFDEQGRLESTFGTAGVARISVGGDDPLVRALGTTGGWTAFAGRVGPENATILFAGRLDAQGNPDPRMIGEAGFMRVSAFAPQAMVTGADGAFIVGGRGADGEGRTQIKLIRFRGDGSVDPAWGPSGLVNYNPVAGASELLTDMIQDRSGRLLVYFYLEGSPTAAVARLNSNATPDASFGDGGLTLFDVGQAPVSAQLGLDGNGRILAVGATPTASTGNADLFIVRLLADGALDPSFGTQGRHTIDLGSTEDIRGVAIDDDRLLVVGWQGAAGAEGGLVARVLLPP